MNFTEILEANTQYPLLQQDAVKLIMENANVETVRPIGINGEVQSGKTTAIQEIAAESLDAGFCKTVIIFTQNTLSAHSQIYKRFKIAFKSDKKEVFFITEKNIGHLNIGVVEGYKFIIVRKNTTSIKKLIDLFIKFPMFYGKNILVIDDESDYQSHNHKNGTLSKTGKMLIAFRNSLKRPYYLQVSATLYANMLQNTEEFSPWLVTTLKTSHLYKGREYFFRNPNKTAMAIRNNRLDVGEFKNWSKTEFGNLMEYFPVLTESIVSFFISVMNLRCEEGNQTKKYCMLVHISHLTYQHIKQKEIIESIIKKIIELYDTSKIQIVIKECYLDLEKSTEGKLNFTFEETLKYLKEYIYKNNQVEIFNGQNKSILDSDYTIDFNSVATIITGSRLMNRSQTFENMLGFYYARNIKRYKLDAQQQEFRFYGHHSERHLEFMRIYATEKINYIWEEMSHRAVVYDDKCCNNEIYEETGCERAPKIEDPNIGYTSSSKINKKVKQIDSKEIMPKNISVTSPNIYGTKEFLRNWILNEDKQFFNFNGIEKEYYNIPVIKVKEFIRNVLFEIDFENKEIVEEIDYTLDLAAKAGVDTIKTLVRFDRNKSKFRIGTNIVNESPHKAGGKNSDEKLAKALSNNNKEIILTILHQKGLVEKRWDDNVFLWPILRVPRNYVK